MLFIDCCGDDTLSVAVSGPAERRALANALRESGTWLECVEGRRSIVVQFDAGRMSFKKARKRLRKQFRTAVRKPEAAVPQLEIPLCYGGDFGPEFTSICEMLGLSADEFIAIHTGEEHTVDMLGFVPGFAYIDGPTSRLSVPRLAEPRQRVAAGSVGIADGQTGLYALAGPGGWPLIGRTPLPLFRADKPKPFLLQAGTRVRFVAIDEQAFHRLQPA